MNPDTETACPHCAAKDRLIAEQNAALIELTAEFDRYADITERLVAIETERAEEQQSRRNNIRPIR